jgi:hypothetical protein
MRSEVEGAGFELDKTVTLTSFARWTCLFKSRVHHFTPKQSLDDETSRGKWCKVEGAGFELDKTVTLTPFARCDLSAQIPL